jgi:hypothetical protein
MIGMAGGMSRIWKWSRAPVAVVCLVLSAACQTTNDREQFDLAKTAGFDESGAALPIEVSADPETTREAEAKSASRSTSEDRGGAADTSLEVSAARYKVLPIAPNERPPSGSDEAGLWMQADRVENAIKTSATRIVDPALEAYVGEIVCRVAGAYCADVRTYILRIPAFNATMSANGMMQIFTGFMIRVTSEAELASVIGHEVGHYLLRHGVIGHRRRVDYQTGSMMIGIIAGAGGVPSLADLTRTMATGAFFEYNRDQERQSDGYGYVMMTRAGYDPTLGPGIWYYLLEEAEAMGLEDKHFFTRTHPLNIQRAEEGMRLAKELKAEATGELVSGQDRYVQKLLPYRDMLLQDELENRQFPVFQVLLDKWRDIGVRNGEIEFFQGELFRLRADEEEDDLHSAISVYETALELEGAPPRIHRSMGLVYRKLDMRERARESFERYLEAVPEAEDRSLIELMLREDISS